MASGRVLLGVVQMTEELLRSHGHDLRLAQHTDAPAWPCRERSKPSWTAALSSLATPWPTPRHPDRPDHQWRQALVASVASGASGCRARRRHEYQVLQTEVVRPRFSAPMTLVVIPEECQSIPITAPNDWNQKGFANRRNGSSRPNSWTIAAAITTPWPSGHSAISVRAHRAAASRHSRNAASSTCSVR